MRIRSYASCLLVLATVLLLPLVLNGHSPYQPTVLFFNTEFPYRPVANFANGNLGVLQPTWYRGYLVVFYRYLTGRPLSRAEQSSFLAHAELHPKSALQPIPSNSWQIPWQPDGPPQQWVRARARFRKDKPPSSEAEWWTYTSGDDCLGDSFRTAIKTLRDRAKRYGPQSRELQDWITAQDQVYQNCPVQYGARPTQGVIPAELPTSAAALVRADRAYQIAAANLYASNSEEAIRRFSAIGKDSNSPWHDLAIYLVARATLRQAAPTDESPFDAKRLAEADTKLQAASAEIADRHLKESIAGLRQYVALRLRPDEEYRSLARRISEGNAGVRFGQDVIDFGYLVDRFVGTTPDFPGVNEWDPEYRVQVAEWRDHRYSELRQQRTASDLTDWLLTIQWQTPAAAQHAVDRWQKARSLQWLLAALIVAHGNDKTVDALLEAAAHVTPDSPAYVTVVLHKARLLRERGDSAAARQVMDDALLHSDRWPLSTLNILKHERFLVADSAAEFARLLPSQPVGFDNGTVANGESEYCATDSGYASASSVICEKGIFEGGSPRRLLPQIDDQSARMLNQSAPLDLLLFVARSESLPENIRKEMTPAMWARAAILDRQPEAASVAETAASVRPELKPYIDAYQKAATSEERKFLAAYAIAHFPGLRPAVNGSTPRLTRFDYADNYRDNWWCSNGLPQEFRSWSQDRLPQPPVPQVAFLSAEQRDRGAREFRQIVDLGSPNDWLADVLIRWAKAHPHDPRSPEALHFAWRAVRYGCDGNKNRSREVFVLLHSRYPSSIWTKKTRVWW